MTETPVEGPISTPDPPSAEGTWLNILIPPSRKAQLAFVFSLLNSAGLLLLGSWCLYRSVAQGHTDGAAAALGAVTGTNATVLVWTLRLALLS